MTEDEFSKLLESRKEELVQMMRFKAPTIAGIKLKNFFKENYRKGGYVDGGFHLWPITKRQQTKCKGAAYKYGPLLSKRNWLFSNISYMAGDGVVTIFNNVPYSKIHNEGGEIAQNINITPKMRKYFWYLYFKELGVKKSSSSKRAKKGHARVQRTKTGNGYYTTGNEIADKYARMALSKGPIKRTIKIPKRPFIYQSAEVSSLVKDIVKQETIKILTGKR